MESAVSRYGTQGSGIIDHRLFPVPCYVVVQQLIAFYFSRDGDIDSLHNRHQKSDSIDRLHNRHEKFGSLHE